MKRGILEIRFNNSVVIDTQKMNISDVEEYLETKYGLLDWVSNKELGWSPDKTYWLASLNSSASNLLRAEYYWE